MHKLLEEIESNRKSRITVCNDPVNEYAGDFAEDFDRSLWRMVTDAKSDGISDDEISEAIERGTKAGETDLAGTFEARKRN